MKARPRIEFFVPGIPQPGGSKRAFVVTPRGGGKPRAVVTEDCKRNKPWRQSVQACAVEAYDGEPLTGAVMLDVVFYMPRPKGHFGTGRNADKLKPSAPAHHTKKPDTTKLLRAAEDALTGILWRDDCQIVEQVVGKEYGRVPGATFIVRSLEG